LPRGVPERCSPYSAFKEGLAAFQNFTLSPDIPQLLAVPICNTRENSES
jgi:hypothetical protein